MTDTYNFVRSILISSFRIPEDEIRPEVTPVELGLDSVARAKLAVVLDDRLEVEVDREYVINATSLAEIVEYLDELHAGGADGTAEAS